MSMRLTECMCLRGKEREGKGFKSRSQSFLLPLSCLVSERRGGREGLKEQEKKARNSMPTLLAFAIIPLFSLSLSPTLLVHTVNLILSSSLSPHSWSSLSLLSFASLNSPGRWTRVMLLSLMS